MLPMITMCPPCSRCGSARRVMRTSPLMFVSMIVCSSSSVESTNGSRPSASPALLTRMSTPPSSSRPRSRNEAQLARSVTSSSSATSASIASTRRAPPATRTPASRNCFTVASPMPLDAPVTIALLPRSSTDAMRLTLTGLNRQQPRFRVLDLQGRVVESEALPEHHLEIAPNSVAVAFGRDEHVRGKRGEAAGDRPHVQVVHLDDVILGDKCSADDVRVYRRRGGFEEDRRRLVQQPP